MLDRGSTKACNQPRRGGGNIDSQSDDESAHPHEIGAVGRREHALNSSVIWPRVCMMWHSGRQNRPVASAVRSGRVGRIPAAPDARGGKERVCLTGRSGLGVQSVVPLARVGLWRSWERA